VLNDAIALSMSEEDGDADTEAGGAADDCWPVGMDWTAWLLPFFSFSNRK
jgi:hypothetical protein